MPTVNIDDISYATITLLKYKWYSNRKIVIEEFVAFADRNPGEFVRFCEAMGAKNIDVPTSRETISLNETTHEIIKTFANSVQTSQKTIMKMIVDFVKVHCKRFTDERVVVSSMRMSRNRFKPPLKTDTKLNIKTQFRD